MVDHMARKGNPILDQNSKYEASDSRSHNMSTTFYSKTPNKNRASYPISNSYDKASHCIGYKRSPHFKLYQVSFILQKSSFQFIISSIYL